MSKVRILGHALHPMLVVFPLGLLATSVVWDAAYLAGGETMWAQISFWSIVAGLVGAALAAIPGLIDFLAIPQGTRARRIGAWHLGLNLTLVGLLLVSALLRAGSEPGGYATPRAWHMLFGWAGVAVGLVSGWLGGELVERLGVAVYRDANPNAPSSFRTREPRPVA